VYEVVLLVERELTQLDAEQVAGLHQSVGEPVHYQVLLPVEDASAQVQSALGSIARYDLIPPVDSSIHDTLARLDQLLVVETEEKLFHSIALLRATGAEADGELIPQGPVAALVDAVQRRGAREAIVLTEPHAVRDFLHVDWTSKARRVLGIPLLHLLEHETFDEQAGGGEGVSGA